MKNIMIDLETMSTASNAAIVSIGAVEFDELEIISEFYTVVDLQSCIDKGLTIDGSTVMWWLNQDKKARDDIRAIKGKLVLKDALNNFKDWFPKGNVQAWGNGATFDNVILSNCFKAFRAEAPWPFYMDRCFRTMKNSYPTLEIPNVGTHHNALDDAKWQAEYLQALVVTHRLTEVL